MSTLGALIDEFKLHIGAAVALALGAMRMRRKLASDNVEVATDNERRRWVDNIVGERDALVAEVRSLREQLGALREQMGALTVRLEHALTEVERLTHDLDRREHPRPGSNERRKS